MGRRIQVVIRLVDVDSNVVLLSMADRPAVLDEPNGILSHPYLDSFPTLSVELPSDSRLGLARGKVGGVAETSFSGNPRILNPRKNAPTLDRVSDFLLGSDFGKSIADIFVTDLENPVQDLSDPSWSTYGAMVSRIAPLGTDALELRLEPLEALLKDEKLPNEIYRGFGGACPRLAPDDELSFSSGSGIQPSLTDPFAFTLAGVVLQAGDLDDPGQIWLRWGDGTDGIQLLANVGGNGNLQFTTFGLSPTPVVTTANNVITEDGRSKNITIRRTAAGIFILIDGVDVGSEAATGTIDDPAVPSPLTIGTKNSTISAIGEFHAWVIAPTNAQLSTLLNRVALPLPAGMLSVTRDNSLLNDVWLGADGIATDGGGDSAMFQYGLSGNLSNRGFSRPEALGAVLHVEPVDVRPENFVFDLHFGEEITSVTLRQRGEEVVVGAGTFVLNDPGEGLIRFITDPHPMSEIRVSFTGDTALSGVYNGLDLLRRHLFFPGSPLLAIGFQTPAVRGPSFETEVADYLRSVKGGHRMDEVGPRTLRGLDAVLCSGTDGKLYLLRVPLLDWAVPFGDSLGEADVTLTADVDFSTDDLTVIGDSGPGIHTAGEDHSIVVDVSDPKDIDLLDVGDPPPPQGTGDPADLVIRQQMTQESLEALARRGDAFEAANPGSVEGATIPSFHVREVDALEAANRRLDSSQPGERIFRISNLRRTHGAYELGSRVYLVAPEVSSGDPDEPLAGIPCRVVAARWPMGGLELAEQRLARVRPDEIVVAGNFNATVDEISDHPLEASTDFADSTSNTATLRVGFAAPPAFDDSVGWLFRMRIEGAGSDVTRVEMALSESGSTVATLDLTVLAGTATHSSGLFTVAVGDVVVFGAVFDPTLITDLAELECFVTLTGPAGATAKVFSIDYRYAVR